MNVIWLRNRQSGITLPAVLIVVLFVIILSGIWVWRSGFFASDVISSNQETYVSLSECTKEAKSVITNFGIDDTKIHSCEAVVASIPEESIQVVTIEYGPANDCPSGCIYLRERAVVTGDATIIEIPAGNESTLASELWKQDPLNTIRTKSNVKCDELVQNTDVSLVKYETYYGYRIRFTNPFTCTWDEYNEETKTVDEQKITLEGDVFVHIQDGQEVWEL